MRTVYKYAIPVDDSFSIEMPRGAEILTAQVQHGSPFVWALVDPDAPREHVRFWLAGTGHPIADNPRKYVGTFQLHGGGLVFHLFVEASS